MPLQTSSATATPHMHFLSLPILERKQAAEGVTQVTFGLDGPMGSTSASVDEPMGSTSDFTKSPVDGNTFDFEPGQFVRVIVPELKVPDTRGASRDFTISSLPNGKSISITFQSGKLSGFKQTLLSLPLGGRVAVSGPFGEMTLPALPSRPLVFVAGGIGIAAFISKIRYALSPGKNYRITLLWSASDEAQMPYLSELKVLARAFGKRFTFVEVIGSRIDADALKKYSEAPEMKTSLWQIAGPREMVLAMRFHLASLGVKEEDVRSEEYEGYGPSTGESADFVARPAATNGGPSMASARRSAGSALRRAEGAEDHSLFTGLLDALNKTAIVSATDAEGTITFANDKLLEVSKYKRKELIGQNHRILKSGHHPPAFYREMWETISSGRIWRGEIKNRAKDGSFYWVDTSIAPVPGESGSPESYVSVRFVITDRKEAEEVLSMYRYNLENVIKERTDRLSAANESLTHQIERRAELERKLRAHAEELADADRNKDEFIAVLSHELRNPLSSVMSALELIEMQGADHPSTHELVASGHAHLRILARLLDDLMDASRISRKKLKIEKEVLAVEDVLRSVAEGAAPRAEEKKHRIVLHLPRTLTWVEADPVRLAQVFGNVLSNAIKYTGEGGVIEVGCARKKNWAVVRVKDNGIGIPKDMIERIFDMFVQAKTAGGNGAGLGIGLSLARNLLEMHGGTIEAKSPGEGKGSEFVMRLPVLKRLPIASATQAGLPAPVRRQMASREKGKQNRNQKQAEKQFRILVVDDNESAALSMGFLLRRRGHTVALAHEWRSALKEAANGYDAVLLDIGMPEVSGYDIARRIRREVKSPPALIALTGFGQDEDKRKAEAAGFAYHLTKPAGLSDVERALRKVLLPK